MKRTKRLLTLLLSLALTLSLLPGMALAAEEDVITRVEFAEKLYNHPSLGLSGRTSSSAEPFTDLDGLTDVQKNAFGVLKDVGIMVANVDGSVRPLDPMRRFEVAVFIMRIAGSINGGAPVTLPNVNTLKDTQVYDALTCLYAKGILTDADMGANGDFRPYDTASAATVDAWLEALLKKVPNSAIPKKSITSFTPQELAAELKSLGLFMGNGELADGTPDFGLDSAPNRIQAVIMMIRVLGQEQAALSGSWSHPYQDVADWADAYVGYAQEHGLAGGISGTAFAPNNTATVNMYLTYVLRALGYSDAGGNADFSWTDPYDLAQKAGILPVTVNRENFRRADMVIVSAAALSAKLKGSQQTLAEKLIADGVFTEKQYSASALSKVASPEELASVPVTVVEMEKTGEIVTNFVIAGPMTLISCYRDDGTVKPVVIVFNANHGSKKDRLPEARGSAEVGFYALLVDCASAGDNASGPLDAVRSWAVTVPQLDATLDYFATVPQADTEHFGLTGSSANGSMCFAYAAHGKYTPTIIALGAGTPDYTQINDMPFFDRVGYGAEDEFLTHEELRAFAAEYSPANYPERFLNIYIYTGIGTEDETVNPDGLRKLENALKELGGTKFIFQYFEGLGHENLPGGSDFDTAAALRQVLLGWPEEIFDLD